MTHLKINAKVKLVTESSVEASHTIYCVFVKKTFKRLFPQMYVPLLTIISKTVFMVS